MFNDEIKGLKSGLLLFGLITVAACNFFYFFYGYSLQVLILWIASLITIAVYFAFRDKSRQLSLININRFDLYTLILLFVVFTPFYLLYNYTIPFQVNTDEILLTGLTKNSIVTPDIFSISSYSYHPSFIFVIFRFVTEFMGGTNLLNMRMLHSFFGLIIILSAYLFFRQLSSGLVAFTGAVLLGFQHSFLAISRMAMRDNVPVLLVVLAVTLFFVGVKRRSYYWTFLCGVIVGFTFYNYYPGQISIFLIILFLLNLSTFFRKNINFKTLIKLSGVWVLGIILTVVPLLISVYRVPDFHTGYYRQNSWQFKQLLILPEGRIEQKLASGVATELEVIKINILQGLTIFNNNIHDQGRVYPNLKHGFVDPFSGLLVWIGIVLLIYRRKMADFLVLGSFFIILFVISFVVNKAPHFTRALIILPFFVFIVSTTLQFISDFIDKLIYPRISLKPGKFVFVFLASVIIIWNLALFSEFIRTGFKEGNDYGGAARYVEERRNLAGYSFFVATNDQYRFFTWGGDGISMLVNNYQNISVLDPDNFIEVSERPPFTIFMNKDLWLRSGPTLKNIYPYLKLHNIKPDGSLLAIEVK